MNKLHLQMIVIILFGLLSPGLLAQESDTNKIKELYLSGNLLTFNNFGIQYKSELRNGNFFRIGVTNIFSNVSKQNFGQPSIFIPSSMTEFAGTFEVGLEKRSQITDRLTAFYGVNFVTTTSFQRTKTEDPSLSLDLRHLDVFNINPGLGFNSGFIYKISNEFSISAEVSPKLLYNYTSKERISGSNKVNDTTQGGSFNLDNQSVKISLIYKWTSK
ncbi:MAG: hypothetical protein NTV31_11565 [Bacteroidia bacterium]|nr:hypothetical protein [Bacteroidia bacterium]